ncbi:GTPase IMAP family member 3 [Danio aesculapii]|uniref:GTPase IMAP family member 3 n=1 Tax=Danio aesculapii TaxID=1142201 RepID=UPI0024C0CC6D|nr:GTPase IMAP family member 3 [Danio aesculapii]
MSLSKETNEPQFMEQNTVVLLIGKSGCGKSITGNMIFNASVFESRLSSTSVTRVSQTHTASVNNRRLTVVDTPDFRFSTHTDFDSNSELKTTLRSCAPGAHVILLFLPLSTFTEQEQEFIHWFEQKFGAEALRFTLVLFTHADKPHMRTLGELIRGNGQLSDFINRCGRRYHEFNIKAPVNSRQVTELMEKVKRLVSENSHSCYTLEMMEDEEKRRKEKERREKEKKEGEHQITLERVRRETEMRVRREYEEERQWREEEEKKEREHQITLERVRRETEIRVRRENEEDRQKRERMKLFKQIILRRIYVITVFSVVTGFVLVSRKDSSLWIFMCGFITGGSAATTGVCCGIFWRLMWRSPFISSSPHESPSALRHFLLKTTGVVCGLTVGAAIGHLVGGNLLPVTLITGLAGAAGALTSLQRDW